MIGVGCIFQDAVGSVEAAGPVDVLQRGRGESNDLLCGFDDSLEAFAVCLCTVGIPGS